MRGPMISMGGDVMKMRTGVIALALFAAAAGSGLVLVREPERAGQIESQQLFLKELADDPSKEVNAQSYTFPPGAILPWHIHPDADEIAYIIEGTFTFQRASEEPKVLHAGEADYVEPNVVHRGMNLSDAPVKLFVVRIKPKDKPLVTDVPAP
jgi:quercetin dioxygenase-like cupin family protein